MHYFIHKMYYTPIISISKACISRFLPKVRLLAHVLTRVGQLPTHATQKFSLSICHSREIPSRIPYSFPHFSFSQKTKHYHRLNSSPALHPSHPHVPIYNHPHSPAKHVYSRFEKPSYLFFIQPVLRQPPRFVMR